MKVQRVENNPYYTMQNHSKKQPSFGMLKIKESYWIACPEILHEFTNNKNVQEFITIMHNRGIDVIASLEYKTLPEPHKIQLAVKDFFTEIFYEMRSDKISMFSVEDALAGYKKNIEGSKLRDKKLDSQFKEEMDAVRSFNKSLRGQQEEQTSEIAEATTKSKQKKWWQFWGK